MERRKTKHPRRVLNAKKPGRPPQKQLVSHGAISTAHRRSISPRRLRRWLHLEVWLMMQALAEMLIQNQAPVRNLYWRGHVRRRRTLPRIGSHLQIGGSLNMHLFHDLRLGQLPKQSRANFKRALNLVVPSLRHQRPHRHQSSCPTRKITQPRHRPAQNHSSNPNLWR